MKINLMGIKEAQPYIPFLEKYCEQYSINTKLRMAAFLANSLHESGDFKHVEENLNYSQESLCRVWSNRFKSYDGSATSKALEIAHNPQKIANCVYANRGGNGDELSGDGWKYRGRGLFQLTFKDNYMTCGKAIGLDLVKQPELLSTPSGASASACWYWSSRDLNKHADKGDFDTICDIINIGHATPKIGDAIGYKERLNYYNKLLILLGE